MGTNGRIKGKLRASVFTSDTHSVLEEFALHIIIFPLSPPWGSPTTKALFMFNFLQEKTRQNFANFNIRTQLRVFELSLFTFLQNMRNK